MRNIIILIVTLLPLTYAIAAPNGADVIPLPQEDREQLDKFLGKGVVGKAVVGQPFDKPGKADVYTDGGSWEYKITSGKKSGSSCNDTIVPVKGKDGNGWQYTSCLGLIDFKNTDDKGNIILPSTVDKSHGVVSKFDPPMITLKSGMAPGDKSTQSVEIKVYDLSNPKRQTHSGKLDLTLQYVGAYEVTVPAGTFEAARIKWELQGKIGPAKYQDVQYRLVSPDDGLIALVERKDPSAIFYHQEVQVGKVLEKK